MIKYLVLFLLFCSINVYSQQKKTTADIDNRLESTTMLYAQGKIDEYISANTTIIEDSKKINYSKGIAMGNVRLAAVYYANREFKKSIICLDIAEKENYTSTDYELQATIKRELGRIYFSMDLLKPALQEFWKMKTVAAKIENPESRNFSINAAENNIGSTYHELHQTDSAVIYYSKVYKNLNAFKNKSEKQNALLNITTINIAEIKISQTQLDSAEHYLRMYNSFETNGKNEFTKFMALKLMGKIYFAKKQYKLSVDYYHKAIQVTKNAKYTTDLKDLYYLIYESYDKIGDQENAKEYLEKYTFLKDSISSIEKSNMDAPINRLIEEKEKPLQLKNRSLLYWGLCLGTILVIIIISIRYKHRGEKREITGKIITKEQETIELKKKLNLAFEEVVQLAKKNDPEFLTRFQEVYPDFFSKLLRIEPQLLTSELKFCALLFLNFSSKDIAEYTFVQPQSIQTRKNRLRKKLNIASDEDIYIWMQNINTK